MKNLCLTCGAEIPTPKPNKIFCSAKCSVKFHNMYRPLLIKENFKVFQNITAMADNFGEFRNLFKEHFIYEGELK